jgi:hypothetical protein
MAITLSRLLELSVTWLPLHIITSDHSHIYNYIKINDLYYNDITYSPDIE